MYVSSDAIERFVSEWKCIQEVKVWMYHHWLLKYLVMCGPVISAGAYSNGYLNMQ